MSKKTKSVVSGRQKMREYENGKYAVYTILVEIEGSGDVLYYVGRSKNLDDRLKAHKRPSSNISHFTKAKGQVNSKYKVKELISVERFENISDAQFREREKFVELSAKKGIENVAGGI